MKKKNKNHPDNMSVRDLLFSSYSYESPLSLAPTDYVDEKSKYCPTHNPYLDGIYMPWSKQLEAPILGLLLESGHLVSATTRIRCLMRWVAGITYEDILNIAHDERYKTEKVQVPSFKNYPRLRYADMIMETLYRSTLYVEEVISLFATIRVLKFLGQKSPEELIKPFKDMYSVCPRILSVSENQLEKEAIKRTERKRFRLKYHRDYLLKNFREVYYKMVIVGKKLGAFAGLGARYALNGPIYNPSNLLKRLESSTKDMEIELLIRDFQQHYNSFPYSPNERFRKFLTIVEKLPYESFVGWKRQDVRELIGNQLPDTQDCLGTQYKCPMEEFELQATGDIHQAIVNLSKHLCEERNDVKGLVPQTIPSISEGQELGAKVVEKNDTEGSHILSPSFVAFEDGLAEIVREEVIKLIIQEAIRDQMSRGRGLGCPKAERCCPLEGGKCPFGWMLQKIWERTELDKDYVTKGFWKRGSWNV